MSSHMRDQFEIVIACDILLDEWELSKSGITPYASTLRVSITSAIPLHSARKTPKKNFIELQVEFSSLYDSMVLIRSFWPGLHCEDTQPSVTDRTKSSSIFFKWDFCRFFWELSEHPCSRADIFCGEQGDCGETDSSRQST